jgi:hypothetical protein
MYVALLVITMLTAIGVTCLVIYSPSKHTIHPVWHTGNCTEVGAAYSRNLTHDDCMAYCLSNNICYYAVRLIGDASACYMSVTSTVCHLLANNVEYEVVARSSNVFT